MTVIGAGYTLENWRLLENDLRNQTLSLDAMPNENRQYGQMYEIRGKLTGLNGKSSKKADVATIVEHHPVSKGEDRSI